MKCELLEVELTEKHLCLIFKNYYKAEKSLPCLFCHFNSTIDLGFNPVALCRRNSKLSKYIKFVKFGQVDLSLLNFEKGTRNEFQTDLDYSNLNNWAGGKRDGPAQLRVWRERAA